MTDFQATVVGALVGLVIGWVLGHHLGVRYLARCHPDLPPEDRNLIILETDVLVGAIVCVAAMVAAVLLALSLPGS